METFDALILARLQFAFTDLLSHRISGLQHRARQLPGRARGSVARHWPRRLPGGLQLLEEGVRAELRHGRRVGRRHELPVRHQLERVLRQDRPHPRPPDGLRGDVGVLPGGRLPRRHAVRHEARRPRPALLRHADGRNRHLHLGLLDPVGQQLDAHARRLRHQRRRPVRGRQLVGGDLQSRPSPTGSCTWCSPPISPPPSWSAPSAPSICCATAPTRRRG